MKKILLGSLVGLALVAFTGCTDSKDATVGSKCQSGKCQGDKKTDKTMAKKCGDAKAAAKKYGS